MGPPLGHQPQGFSGAPGAELRGHGALALSSAWPVMDWTVYCTSSKLASSHLPHTLHLPALPPRVTPRYEGMHMSSNTQFTRGIRPLVPQAPWRQAPAPLSLSPAPRERPRQAEERGALTLLIPIRPERVFRLALFLRRIGRRIPDNPHIHFKRLTTVHFLRWALLPAHPESGQGPLLMAALPPRWLARRGALTLDRADGALAQRGSAHEMPSQGRPGAGQGRGAGQ